MEFFILDGMKRIGKRKTKKWHSYTIKQIMYFGKVIFVNYLPTSF